MQAKQIHLNQTLTLEKIALTLAIAYMGLFPGVVAYIAWSYVLSGDIVAANETVEHDADTRTSRPCSSQVYHVVLTEAS